MRAPARFIPVITILRMTTKMDTSSSLPSQLSNVEQEIDKLRFWDGRRYLGVEVLKPVHILMRTQLMPYISHFISFICYFESFQFGGYIF